MPVPGVALERLGFLTIGLFDADDPAAGHESTLEIIELGERLGFDSAWVRHRHLQYGISSPVAVLAAATQRTSRIELGTAVIPLGWENPLRLAEDLATVDILSGGRLNPGISVGPPMHYDDVKDALYPDTAEPRTSATTGSSGCWPGRAASRPADVQRHRGLRGVLRPGAAALPGPARPPLVRRRRPALGPVGRRARHELPDQQRRAGRGVARTSPRSSSPTSTPSAPPTPTAPRPGCPRAWSSSRPTRATAEQREKYAAYVAARTPRTAAPQGPARMMFAPRPDRHLERDRRTALRARRLPRGRRGRVRPAVHLRPRRLRPDPHRHRRASLGPALGWAPGR